MQAVNMLLLFFVKPTNVEPPPGDSYWVTEIPDDFVVDENLQYVIVNTG
jgi:hypothetical protein